MIWNRDEMEQDTRKLSEDGSQKKGINFTPRAGDYTLLGNNLLKWESPDGKRVSITINSDGEQAYSVREFFTALEGIETISLPLGTWEIMVDDNRLTIMGVFNIGDAAKASKEKTVVVSSEE